MENAAGRWTLNRGVRELATMISGPLVACLPRAV